jgi:hypothetical protein
MDLERDPAAVRKRNLYLFDRFFFIPQSAFRISVARLIGHPHS